MNEHLGFALIVLGALAAIVLAVIWRRLEMRIAIVASALAGAIVGAGALLVQDEGDAAEWIVTLVGFGVLAPLHTHLVRSERRP